jgi:hypothetical protein
MAYSGIYLVGGPLGKTFYSGDIWTIARFLYNTVLAKPWDFDKAGPGVQMRLLNQAYELEQIVKYWPKKGAQ